MGHAWCYWNLCNYRSTRRIIFDLLTQNKIKKDKQTTMSPDLVEKKCDKRRNGEETSDYDCAVEDNLFNTASFLETSRKTVSAERTSETRF